MEYRLVYRLEEILKYANANNRPLGDGGAIGSMRAPTGRTRWSKMTGTLFSKLCIMVGEARNILKSTIVELSRTGGPKSYAVFHRSASKIEAYIEDEDFSEQNSTGRLRGFMGAAMVELHLWRLSNKSSAAHRVRASNCKTDL